jgi:hypothetical protein
MCAESSWDGRHDTRAHVATGRSHSRGSRTKAGVLRIHLACFFWVVFEMMFFVRDVYSTIGNQPINQQLQRR